MAMTVSTESYALIHELLALGIERFTTDDEVLVEITSSLESLLIKEDSARSAEHMKASTKQLATRTQAVNWKKSLRTLKEAQEKMNEAVETYKSAVENASGNRGSTNGEALKHEHLMHKAAAAAVLELGNQLAGVQKAKKVLV